MVTLDMPNPLTCYRTKLMSEQAASRFSACLRANRRFTDVKLCHSSRATHDEQWFVTFSPSSAARQEALLHRHQQARAERAAHEPFVFAANSIEVYCYSPNSGNTYQMRPDGTGCSCPDQQERCRGLVRCKHEIGWLASDEKREMDAAKARRAETSKLFDEIFL